MKPTVQKGTSRKDSISLIFHSPNACQNTERSPINDRLPGEVPFDIFYCYRQSINSYNYNWQEKYAWFNLAHVCRKWRAVIFASPCRLDLNVYVKPVKPENIKTILSESGHLPILINYVHLADEPRENISKTRKILEII
jgi:hypothetical protein